MKISIPLHLTEETQELLIAIGKNYASNLIKRNINRYGNPDAVDIDINDLGLDGLASLYELAKDKGERGLMMQITSYKKIIASPFTAKIGNLKALVPGLVEYFRQDAINGWLYSKQVDGVHVPWLVRSVSYDIGRQMEVPTVAIHLVANVGKVSSNDCESSSSTIRFSSDDIVKRTIPEILALRDYFHETQELTDQYEKDVAMFAEYRPKFGEQFSAAGIGIQSTNSYRKEIINLCKSGSESQLVNDEEEIIRKITDKADNTFWTDLGVENCFENIPFHCRLYMFHLELHENVWVHVSFMKPYVYHPELRDKLILPDLHRDLIDVLTQDMDVMMEDIVAGKSGGTTIMCTGRPGLGKTLTAEVYCQVVKKPLYRVHSGQLGTDAEDVEKALGKILKRSQRWGAVLLIDEADVFVRCRGNDVQHNAIVSSFLRTLEYFSGLLFMTTNRENDIDDAILSRCIAIIKYEHPSEKDAKKIWRVLADQFELSVSDELIDELVSMFQKASGRDIKELLKISSKFARCRNLELNANVFRQCAMFRGIV